MLALVEIPQRLETMYAQYKQLSQAIYNPIQKIGEPRQVPQGTDLFKLTDKLAFVYICEGFFKLLINGKPVRLYSDSDFIVTGSHTDPDAVLTGDFGGQVAIFDTAKIIHLTTRHPKLLNALFKLTDLENRINRALAANLMRQDTNADFTLKEYNEGETIILEGDQSTEIYELLSGEAEAIQGDKTVGKINEGEIFGEVSFFTGEPRNASVKATETCMVRIINQSNFAEMMKTNPNFAKSISRTLAKRFSDVNKRLAQHSNSAPKE